VNCRFGAGDKPAEAQGSWLILSITKHFVGVLSGGCAWLARPPEYLYE
jgi:hypothetical protein